VIVYDELNTFFHRFTLSIMSRFSVMLRSTFVCVAAVELWLLMSWKVPEFPVFTRSGEVTVAVRIVRQVVLSDAELTRLYSFHHFIFRHVLRLEKLPMMFDPDQAETSNIIVPVNKGGTSFLCYFVIICRTATTLFRN